MLFLRSLPSVVSGSPVMAGKGEWQPSSITPGRRRSGCEPQTIPSPIHSSCGEPRSTRTVGSFTAIGMVAILQAARLPGREDNQSLASGLRQIDLPLAGTPPLPCLVMPSASPYDDHPHHLVGLGRAVGSFAAAASILVDPLGGIVLPYSFQPQNSGNSNYQVEPTFRRQQALSM